MKKGKKVGMAELLWGKPPAIVPEWWEQDKKLHEEFLAILEGLHAHDRLSFMLGKEELPDGVLREEAEWRLREMHEHAGDLLLEWHKRIAAHRKSFTKPRKAAQERHAREHTDKQNRDELIKSYVLTELKKKPYHMVRAAARKKFGYEYEDDPRRSGNPRLLSYSSVDKIISKARKESPHRG